MTVRTCVHPSRDSQAAWTRLADELAETLAGRGVLRCPGVAAALLDVGHQMAGCQGVAGSQGVAGGHRRAATDDSATDDSATGAAAR